jgi:N-acetylated-alpha-linked acidic dipeptidase
LGIDTKGKIALARYGRSFRGIKVKAAEEHGAAGIIIYSDPQDDGYDQGDIYPRGPMRPWDAVQRGSIQDLTIYPGDPLTPGYASTKDAKRIALSDVTDLPHIPCMPISYGNAERLLTNLSGPAVPHDWQGGLPFTYHIGPGPTEVNMKIEMDYGIRPIWDVIGTISGRGHPDQKVIIGNHRDAWVFGAVDPNSGTASMLEAARGFGELLKTGWKPERTINFCSWDGEEYGLIGSTEWGEENAEALAKHAVAYVNVDAPVSGTNFGSSTVPSLDKFVMDLTRSVTDPKTQKSVFDAWYIGQNKAYFEKHESVPDTAATSLGRLGSGSDFSVFLDHLGIPSFDFGFGGPYGVYHSALDNFYWMEHWGDPTFQYHATVAKLLGIAALRLADDSLLPFRYSDYSREIEKYIKEKEKTASEEANLKSVDFTPTINAAREFDSTAHKADSLLLIRKINDYTQINSYLMEMERAFTEEEGLPQSPWSKHQIYAPGFYTGYASQPLPGISRAVEKKDTQELDKELKILDGTLERATLIECKIVKELGE